MTAQKTKAPSMARLTIVLFLITAVTSLLLGLVNHITKDRIAAAKAEKTQLAMQDVMPEGASSASIIENAIIENPIVMGIYDAESKGYIILVAPSGFGGAIEMAVGVDNSGAVTGVSIIKMSETSGLGTNASDPEWLGQFRESAGPFKVDKDGGGINALTGATVTSRAVAEGVNAALDAAAAQS